MNDRRVRVEMRALYDVYPDLELVETQGRHRLKQRRSVLRLAPKQGVGAEIGVFTGMFSEVLAEVTIPHLLHLVDPWDRLHGSSFPSWGPYTAGQSLSTKAALEAVIHRSKFLQTECEVTREFAHEWLAKFKEPFLDWAYLDAKHTYMHTYDTLKLLSARLKAGGVLMGDDCWLGENHKYNQVYQAVRDFIEESQFVMIHLDQNGQWAITAIENTLGGIGRG